MSLKVFEGTKGEEELITLKKTEVVPIWVDKGNKTEGL